MSNFQDFSDRKRARKAPEKSNFVHTCNLLSQFIKEKGSLRDLNFEIGDRVESLESIVKADKSQVAASTRTKSLTNMEKPVQESTKQDTSMDPIPRRGMPGSSSNLQDAANKAVKRQAATMESKNAQLTIFYAGRVLVFDDYPPEKVTELAEFASKESSKEPEGISSNHHVKEKVNMGTLTAREQLPPRPDASVSRKDKRVLHNSGEEEQDLLPPRHEASGYHKAKGILLNSEIEKMNTGGAVGSSYKQKEVLSPQLEASGSDLPIARRSSLHRFLEKRKDRTVKEQNQIQELQPAYSSKPDEQLELKL
ncbi:Hypothetical predicted protein [Olea europaea subsp. europaea]|uniref:Protein TIFY n=2 Tax=Olea europaea subsp. europaea TaxID=158383 RepID=A0A8S0RYZ7_OLEEU|nr:Hypothetical predicted protein [Olea europaea subsp. europaea]